MQPDELRLTLMRHAEADLAPLGEPDLARPLTNRGSTFARQRGQQLAREGMVPDQILCSDAERTLLTARHLLAGAKERRPVLLLPALYDSNSDTILALTREHADELAGHVMVVAHNPGAADAAALLAAGDSGTVGAIDRFPPGTAATFTIAGGEWAGLSPRKARLERLMYPSDGDQ